MGGMLVTNKLVCGRSEIEQRLENIIEHDYRSRETDHDMYRGDFGSTQRIVDVGSELKGKSQDRIDKNFEKFEESVRFEKYEIKYQVIGQLGYVARVLKVDVPNPPRKPIRVGLQEFKNVTELKRYLKNHHNPKSFLGKEIICGFNTVGYIRSESRTYKTRPKKLPKKYQWLDEKVVIGFGAYNPV